MACACKKVEKITKLVTNQENKDKRDIKLIFEKLITPLKILFNRLIVGLVFICLLPLLMLYIFFSLLLTGESTLRLPKRFSRNMQKIISEKN